MTPPRPELEAAEEVIRGPYAIYPPPMSLAERIAAALATAHARGRAEGLEAAAQIAEREGLEIAMRRKKSHMRKLWHRLTNRIAAAIRALGGK